MTFPTYEIGYVLSLFIKCFPLIESQEEHERNINEKDRIMANPDKVHVKTTRIRSLVRK